MRARVPAAGSIQRSGLNAEKRRRERESERREREGPTDPTGLDGPCHNIVSGKMPSIRRYYSQRVYSTRTYVHIRIRARLVYIVVVVGGRQVCAKFRLITVAAELYIALTH